MMMIIITILLNITVRSIVDVKSIIFPATALKTAICKNIAIESFCFFNFMV